MKTRGFHIVLLVLFMMLGGSSEQAMGQKEGSWKSKGTKALEKGEFFKAREQLQKALLEKGGLQILHRLELAHLKAETIAGGGDSLQNHQEKERYRTAMARGDSAFRIGAYQAARKAYEKALSVRVARKPLRRCYRTHRELKWKAVAYLDRVHSFYTGSRTHPDIDQHRAKKLSIGSEKKAKRASKVRRVLSNTSRYSYYEKGEVKMIPGNLKRKQSRYKSNKAKKRPSDRFGEQFRETEKHRSLVIQSEHTFVGSFDLDAPFMSLDKGGHGIFFETFQRAWKSPEKLHRVDPEGKKKERVHSRTGLKDVMTELDTLYKSKEKKTVKGVDSLRSIPSGLKASFELFFSPSKESFYCRYLQSVLEVKRRSRKSSLSRFGSRKSYYDPVFAFVHSKSFQERQQREEYSASTDEMEWGIRGEIAFRLDQHHEKETSFNQENPLKEFKSIDAKLEHRSMEGLKAKKDPFKVFLKAHKKDQLTLYRGMACEEAISQARADALKGAQLKDLHVLGALYFDKSDERFHIRIDRIGLMKAQKDDASSGKEEAVWIDVNASTEEG